MGVGKLIGNPTGPREESQESGTAERTREDAVLTSIRPSFLQRFEFFLICVSKQTKQQQQKTICP